VPHACLLGVGILCRACDHSYNIVCAWLAHRFNADVTEVLQDLPRADATVASAGPAAASTAPAPTAGADTPAAPPLSAPPPSAKPGRRLAPLPPNGAPAAEPITGLAGELVALQHIRGALDSAKTSSAEEDNLSKAVGDQSKNYKTLTRTRQYVLSIYAHNPTIVSPSLLTSVAVIFHMTVAEQRAGE
jgi:hypothetical protein